MRNSVLRAIAILLFFCAAGYLGALNLEITGGINFLTFHPDKLRAYSDPELTIKEFQPYPFIFGNIAINNDITDYLGFSVNLTRDNVFRNSIEGQFIVNTDYFSVKAGPFIGAPDIIEPPFFGILGSAELKYPGIVFLEASGSYTLGREWEITSAHVRESAGARLGFWLPFVIPSVSANYKKFTYNSSANENILDYSARLFLSLDFYSKNFPLTIQADAGYQIYSRSYDGFAGIYTDELKGWFLGCKASWQIQKKIKMIANIETPVFIKAAAPMESPLFLRMFKANMGVAINLK